MFRKYKISSKILKRSPKYFPCFDALFFPLSFASFFFSVDDILRFFFGGAILELSQDGVTYQRVYAHAVSYRKLSYIATDKQTSPQGDREGTFLPFKRLQLF